MTVRLVKPDAAVGADVMEPVIDVDSLAAEPRTVALSSGEVFPPEPPVSVVGGAFSVGKPFLTAAGGQNFTVIQARRSPATPASPGCVAVCLW